MPAATGRKPLKLSVEQCVEEEEAVGRRLLNKPHLMDAVISVLENNPPGNSRRLHHSGSNPIGYRGVVVYHASTDTGSGGDGEEGRFELGGRVAVKYSGGALYPGEVVGFDGTSSLYSVQCDDGELLDDVMVHEMIREEEEGASGSSDVVAEAEGLQLHLSSKNTSTGYKGVARRHSGRFEARRQTNGKNFHLGLFDTAVEAAVAYARAVGVAPAVAVAKERAALSLLEEAEAEGLQLHLSSKNTSTGYKGVARHHSGRFEARRSANGRSLHLGLFDTAVEAAVAYAQAVGWASAVAEAKESAMLASEPPEAIQCVGRDSDTDSEDDDVPLSQRRSLLLSGGNGGGNSDALDCGSEGGGGSKRAAAAMQSSGSDSDTDDDVPLSQRRSLSLSGGNGGGNSDAFDCGSEGGGGSKRAAAAMALETVASVQCGGSDSDTDSDDDVPLSRRASFSLCGGRGGDGTGGWGSDGSGEDGGGGVASEQPTKRMRGGVAERRDSNTAEDSSDDELREVRSHTVVAAAAAPAPCPSPQLPLPCGCATRFAVRHRQKRCDAFVGFSLPSVATSRCPPGEVGVTRREAGAADEQKGV